MGEYAKLKQTGERVKLGTCENLYYLRHEHLGLIEPDTSDVHPMDVTEHFDVYRFRFPWPDEDGIVTPGCIGDLPFDRQEPVIWPIGALWESFEFNHENVTFVDVRLGLLNLPCPESEDGARLVGYKGVQYLRSLPLGSMTLQYQKQLADGRVVPVMGCRTCGAKFRVEDADGIRTIAVAFRSMADRAPQEPTGVQRSAAWLHAVADRILRDGKVG